MHLVSTLNPLSKSEGNVPVALFVFEDQRKFLRISEEYKHTIYSVGRAFKINDEDLSLISLSTSSLDICKGRDVVIDGDAYSLMWNVLDEINVKVDGNLVGAVESGKTPRPRKLDAITHVPTSTPTPGPSQQWSHDDNERAATRTTKTQNRPVADNPRGEPAGTRNVRLTAGKGKEESSLPKLLEVPAPLPHRKPDELQPSEDLEDSAWNLSFKKGDASRLDLNSEVRPPTSKNVNQPDVFVLKQELFPKAKKEKADQVSSNSSDESPAKRAPANHQSPCKEQLEPVLQIQPTADDTDPRFEIAIFGPEPNQSAYFKTRGKHPVRKVLQAACRTFGADYNLSHLMLAVSVEDEDRELTHRFECAVDDTVTMCGITSESRLFLRVDEPVSNGYE